MHVPHPQKRFKCEQFKENNATHFNDFFARSRTQDKARANLPQGMYKPYMTKGKSSATLYCVMHARKITNQQYFRLRSTV